MRSIDVHRWIAAAWGCLALAVALSCRSGQAVGQEVAGRDDGVSFAYFSGSNLSRSKSTAIGIYRLSAADGGLTPVVEQPLENPGPLVGSHTVWIEVVVPEDSTVRASCTTVTFDIQQ